MELVTFSVLICFFNRKYPLSCLGCREQAPLLRELRPVHHCVGHRRSERDCVWTPGSHVSEQFPFVSTSWPLRLPCDVAPVGLSIKQYGLTNICIVFWIRCSDIVQGVSWPSGLVHWTQVVRMWVWIPAWPVAALVSLSKTLNHHCSRVDMCVLQIFCIIIIIIIINLLSLLPLYVNV